MIWWLRSYFSASISHWQLVPPCSVPVPPSTSIWKYVTWQIFAHQLHIILIHIIRGRVWPGLPVILKIISDFFWCSQDVLWCSQDVVLGFSKDVLRMFSWYFRNKLGIIWWVCRVAGEIEAQKHRDFGNHVECRRKSENVVKGHGNHRNDQRQWQIHRQQQRQTQWNEFRRMSEVSENFGFDFLDWPGLIMG